LGYNPLVPNGPQSPNDPPAPPTQLNSIQSILPAAYHNSRNELQEVDLGPADSIEQYIARELDVSRLNKIHDHLWLAGRPMSARPLHRQVMLDRQIVVTEQADLHLVWRESRLFLKPLPEFLMDHSVWQNYICRNRRSYECASGFLLSYVWLICHRSDLAIANEKGLLCPKIEWHRWTAFAKSLLSKLDHTCLSNINIRYGYGELRLSRLNWIYRLSANTRSPTNLVRGYMYGYNRYSTFVQRNFAWLLVVSVYITIVLTAMQVGLATTRLNKDDGFQNASYGFTIFSIVAPLVGIIIIMLVLSGLVAFHLIVTVSFKKEVEMKRRTATEDSSRAS
jgi:uncharacterized membrane protein